MAWNEQWSYKVDGTELNDLVKYVCYVPELDQIAPMRNVLVQRDGDYPVFIRAQPAEGRFTFLIAMKSVSTHVVWQTRKAELEALFAPGAYHTLLAQVRGMAAAKSLRFVTEQAMPDFKQKTYVVSTLAPVPVLR